MKPSKINGKSLPSLHVTIISFVSLSQENTGKWQLPLMCLHVMLYQENLLHVTELYRSVMIWSYQISYAAVISLNGQWEISFQLFAVTNPDMSILAYKGRWHMVQGSASWGEGGAKEPLPSEDWIWGMRPSSAIHVIIQGNDLTLHVFPFIIIGLILIQSIDKSFS